MRPVKLFLLALSFYTRIPSPIPLDYKDLPNAAVYLPLVGWLVGGSAAASFMLADTLWPHSTAIILTLGVGDFFDWRTA